MTTKHGVILRSLILPDHTHALLVLLVHVPVSSRWLLLATSLVADVIALNRTWIIRKDRAARGRLDDSLVLRAILRFWLYIWTSCCSYNCHLWVCIAWANACHIEASGNIWIWSELLRRMLEVRLSIGPWHRIRLPLVVLGTFPALMRKRAIRVASRIRCTSSIVLVVSALHF